MNSETESRKHRTPQLRVVFDTSVLYTGSESDLVRQEASNLIKSSKYPDLEIQWFLPEMVRHERQYQMQERALELIPPIARVEKLLAHNLNITKEILIESVEKVVGLRQEELGLLKLELDHSKVDWHQVTLDAAYRRPPFEAGKTEKGFRDSIIVECFLQLVDESPKTPKACRIVLASNDGLIAKAVEARTTGSTNTAVVSTLEELRGLINTLVSQVDETFLASIKPKAEKLFFIPKDESTLYYKERIRDKLKEKFAAELAAAPPGATARKNGTWRISAPNFVKKTGRRIQWVSRIEVEAEGNKNAPQSPAIEGSTSKASPLLSNWFEPAEGVVTAKQLRDLMISPGSTIIGPASAQPASYAGTSTPGTIFSQTWLSLSTITTHKGVDVYEVLWSADVTTARELRRPSIDEIRHLEPRWESVT